MSIKYKMESIVKDFKKKEDEAEQLRKVKNSKAKLVRDQSATLQSRQETIINLRNKRDELKDTLDSVSEKKKLKVGPKFLYYVERSQEANLILKPFQDMLWLVWRLVLQRKWFGRSSF
mmetsp:Transcript_35065/g.41325  ORF Transcript_35065/g.41325 Transcript_35065/m.41325 type:complete len:118 (-) Transcript_35065:458-811(-)